MLYSSPTQVVGSVQSIRRKKRQHMAAYLIFALDITNPEGFREYAERVGPTHEHFGENSWYQGKSVKPWRESGTQTAWQCWSLKVQNRPGAGTPQRSTHRSKISDSRRPTPGSFWWKATRPERETRGRIDRSNHWRTSTVTGLLPVQQMRLPDSMRPTGGQKTIVLCLPVPYATQLFSGERAINEARLS